MTSNTPDIAVGAHRRASARWGVFAAVVSVLLMAAGCASPDRDLMARLRDLESTFNAMPSVDDVYWVYESEFTAGEMAYIYVTADRGATPVEISAMVETLRSGLEGSRFESFGDMGVSWCARYVEKRDEGVPLDAGPCLSLRAEYPVRHGIVDVEGITAVGVDLAEATDGQWYVHLGSPYDDPAPVFGAQATSADTLTADLGRAADLVGPQFPTAEVQVRHDLGAGSYHRGERVTTAAAESALAAALLETTRDIADRVPNQSAPADIEVTVTPERVAVLLDVVTDSDDAVALAASEAREMLRSSGRDYSLSVTGKDSRATSEEETTFVDNTDGGDWCREETTVPEWCNG